MFLSQGEPRVGRVQSCMLTTFNKIQLLDDHVCVLLQFKCTLIYGYFKHMSGSCSIWPDLWLIYSRIKKILLTVCS